ncbi:MAG: EAL domain-containing protein [Rhodospirillales bacterium]|nr:EAL domain-containing protein [Rhodospirillales bacterium]
MSVVEQSIEARPYTGLNWSMARCKLCWRIGISIFIAIFFVEAVVLIFSAARFERDRLAEIEGSGLAWITTIIRVHDNVMDKAAVDAASRELPQLSKILGLTLYDARGHEIGSFGDIPSLRLHQDGAERPTRQVRSDDRRQYQVVWRQGRIGAPFSAVARLDASTVAPQLTAFVWRVVGIAAVLSMVVTLAALMVLSAFVLIPIVRLRRQLITAGQNPDRPEAYIIETDQDDEMGEVTRAFNDMVRRLARSFAEIRAHELALQEANDQLEIRVGDRTQELSEANKLLRQEAAQRQKAEKEISLLSQLPGTNPEPVLRIAENGTIEYVNEPAKALLRRWNADLGGKLPGHITSIVHDVLESGQAALVEEAVNDKIFALTFQPSLTNLVHVFGRDVTSNKEAEERVQRLANHDLLTGLPNRNLFNDRLQYFLGQKKRSQGLAAIHLVNLNNFRRLNATLGLKTGDRVLQESAEILKSCLRASDTIARLGNDEFAIIQSDPRDAHGAATLAQKLIDALKQDITIDGQVIKTTASVGISLLPDDGDAPDQLIRNADLALHEARTGGTGNYRFFVSEMNDQILKRRRIETDLSRALEASEFVLHYQPKINLAAGRIAGVEVLIRWQHPEQGLMPPADFIPVAEQTGQIVPIGAWVLDQACRQVKAWQDEGLPPIKLAVNLSAVQFGEKGLPELVQSCLADSGLDPKFLELEITESVIMNDVAATTEILNRLNGLGLDLSIDDFGTGYSSLSYLELFPVNRIKIDKSFVDGIGQSSGSEAIAKAVVTLGHSLSMEVTAEGVETEAQQTICMIWNATKFRATSTQSR